MAFDPKEQQLKQKLLQEKNLRMRRESEMRKMQEAEAKKQRKVEEKRKKEENEAKLKQAEEDRKKYLEEAKRDELKKEADEHKKSGGNVARIPGAVTTGSKNTARNKGLGLSGVGRGGTTRTEDVRYRLMDKG